VRSKGTPSDVIDMGADLESRISELERLHADHHRNLYAFDDVTLTSCDLQVVLAGQKIVNMLGVIDSFRHDQPVTAATQKRGTRYSLSTLATNVAGNSYFVAVLFVAVSGDNLSPFLATFVASVDRLLRCIANQRQIRELSLGRTVGARSASL